MAKQPKKKQIKPTTRSIAKYTSGFEKDPLLSLKKTFNAMRDSVSILDNKGIIVECNPAMEELTGKSRDAIIGSPCYAVMHGTKKHVKGCPFQIMRTSLQRETMLLELDGKYFSVTVDPILDEQDTLTGAVHIIADITEARSAQQEVKKQEQQFRQIAANIQDVIWNTDLQPCFTYFSPSVTNVLGYTVEEALDLTPEQLFAPESLLQAREHLAAMLQGKDDVYNEPHEYEVLTRDGSIIPVENYTSVLRDADGAPIGFTGITRDIRDRRKTITAVEEQQSFLDSIIDQTPNPMWIAETDGRVTRINNALSELLNVTKEQIENVYNVLEDQQIIDQGFMPLVESVFKKKKTVNFRLDYRTDQVPILETEKPVHVILDIAMSPLLNADGHIMNVICQHRDITEIHKTETALKESDEKFNTFIGDSVYGYAETDLKGKLTLVNKRMEEILGYTAEEIRGKDYAMLMHPDDLESAMGDFAEIFAKENDGPRAHTFMKKNGEPCILEINALPHMRDGRPVGIQMVLLDVTERREQEERIEDLARFPSENPSPVLRVSRDGELLYANQTAQKQFIDKKGKIDPQLNPLINEVFENNASAAAEIASNDIVYSLRFVPIPDSGYVNIYGMDISDRLQAEEALRTNEQYLRSIYNGAENVALITTDLKGSHTHVLDFSPGAEKIFGYTRDEIINQEIACLHLLDDVKRFGGMQKDLKDGKKGFSGETTLIRKSGETFPALFSIYPRFDTHNKIIGTIGVSIDISELKQTQRELLQERDRVQNYLNVAGVMILALDRDGTITMINRKGCELLQSDEEHIIGQNWFRSFLPENVQATVFDYFHQIVTGEKDALDYYENEIITAKGDIRMIAWYNTILRKSDGELTAVLSSGEDITDRHAAEQALRASEEQFRRLYEGMTEGVAMHELVRDKKGAIIDYMVTGINPAYERITGITLEQAIGTKASELYGTGEAPFLELYSKVAEGSAPVWFETYFPPMGKYFNITVFNLRKDQFATVFEDITNRKQSEQRELEHMDNLGFLSRTAMDFVALMQDEDVYAYIGARLNELIGNEAVVIITRYNKETQHIQSEKIYGLGNKYNRIANLLGMEPELIKVKTTPEFLELFTAGRIIKMEGIYELANKTLPQKVCRAIEKLMKFKHVYTMGLMSKGSFLGNVAILPKGKAELKNAAVIEAFINQASIALERHTADLQQKQLREQLMQSQKMEGIGQLAGGIAHDFNNILTAINGYCQLLLPQVKETPLIGHDILEIKKAADRAAGMTRQLLAFSRRQVLQPRIINLNSIVSDMEKMLMRLIGEDIKLETKLKANLPDVKADVSQLEQVIMNLAVNARDAMPGGGKLRVATGIIDLVKEQIAEFPQAKPGRHVFLAFEDNGEGIDAEVIEHIFEPFFSTKAVGEGTGLGLSTVYGIVQQMHGIIRVDSQADQGTVFTIFLPVLETEEAYEKQTIVEHTQMTGDKERILLVEDEKSARDVAVRILHHYGYIVHEAEDAEKGLKSFEEMNGEYDLIISDVVLPGMNGIDLVEELRQRKPGLPVILCSGYTDKRAQIEKINDQQFRFIPKPYEIDELLRLIREVLPRKGKEND